MRCLPVAAVLVACGSTGSRPQAPPSNLGSPRLSFDGHYVYHVMHATLDPPVRTAFALTINNGVATMVETEEQGRRTLKGDRSLKGVIWSVTGEPVAYHGGIHDDHGAFLVTLESPNLQPLAFRCVRTTVHAAAADADRAEPAPECTGAMWDPEGTTPVDVLACGEASQQPADGSDGDDGDDRLVFAPAPGVEYVTSYVCPELPGGLRLELP